MTEEKEQLEKKLKFLKESLESDIISEEEYKQRSQAIEKELADLEYEKEDYGAEEDSGVAGRDTKENGGEEEILSDLKEEGERKKEAEIRIEEIRAEKLNEMEEDREKPEATPKEEKEEKQEITEEEPKKKGKRQEITRKNVMKKEREKQKADEAETIPEKEIENLQEKSGTDKNSKKKIMVFSVLILVVLLAFYFYAFKEANREKDSIIELKPECVFDDDCQMQDKIGICLNANTTEAKCEFKEDKEVLLTIISDKSCISCDTTRMFEVIRKLFPSVKKTEIDYSSEEGKKLISHLEIEALPSYIFESGITEAFNFDKFKRALVESEGKFIIIPSASGSSYYFKRNEVKNKLELFLLPSSYGIDGNVREVLDLFGDDINYSKNLVSEENEKKELSEELGISTYPTFLINNQLKFTGIQPPELIKKKFCELNKLPECETKLSESLK